MTDFSPPPSQTRRRLADLFGSLTAGALIGFCITGFLVAVAVLAPLIAPYGINDSAGQVWEPSSSKFWLGTDSVGRDLLTRLIFALRLTLALATAATMLSFVLGVTVGFAAAVYGRWVDIAVSRFVDLVMAIPTLIFGLAVLSVFPSNFMTLVLVIGLIDSTRVYRVARAIAADLNVMDYVEAATLRGEGKSWIIFREILPNALSPLLSELGLRFIYSILFLSALSFLGLGVQPPQTDLGGMVKENKDGIVFGIGAALVPAATIALLAIGVNLIVDWALKGTSNPRGARKDG
jgi:peptide/nickel transport system permease protein